MSTSLRDLWNFISGTTILWHESLVSAELKRNWKMISSGLSFFRKFGSGTRLGTMKKLEGVQLQFVQRLAQELDLEESQAYDMYRLYLAREYKGSRNRLRTMLMSESQSSLLLQEIQAFYFNERLYLLKILKHIIAFANSKHPYEVEYGAMVKLLIQESFVEEIWSEAANILSAFRSTQSEWKSRAKIVQGIKEYRELLTILLLFSLIADTPKKLLITMIEELKSKSLHLQVRKLGMVDDDINALLQLISCLQVLFVVNGMKLEEITSSDSCDGHSIRQSNEFKELDRVITSLIQHSKRSFCESESIVALSWMVINPTNERLEQQVVEHGAFQYLLDMLGSESFATNTELSFASRIIVYSLLNSLCTLYDESLLCNVPLIFELASEVVKIPELASVFWQEWHSGGLPLLLQAAASRYEMYKHHIVKLCGALASASADSMMQVVNCLQKMPRCYGDVERSQNGSFDALEMLLQEIADIIDNLSHGYELRKVENNVRTILHLFESIMLTDISWCWSHVRQLPMLTEHVYFLVRLISQASHPSLDLLARCVHFLQAVAQIQPLQVLKRLCEVEFLPCVSNSIKTDSEFFSGDLNCFYGNILTCHERVAAIYPVTAAVLKLLHTASENLSAVGESEEMANGVSFCLREILATYTRWKYKSTNTLMEISEGCLNIVSRLLNNLDQQTNRLIKVCSFYLMFTDAGRSVFELVEKGASFVNQAMDMQLSAYEGIGRSVCNVIRLALSVLTRLLQMQASVNTSSPLLTLLTDQLPNSISQPHPVYTIACYIYQRHDPRLPTLATLLLKLIAQNSRLSILACFGNEAEVLRDMYLSRLQAHMEDIHLKSVIVGLLNTSADHQPGLLDMFLNCQSDANSQVTKCNCLRIIVSLIDESRQGSHLCPPELLLACLQFIYSLWKKRHLLARKYLMSNDHLWVAVCAPLNRQVSLEEALLEDAKETVILKDLQSASYAMKIIAQELHESNCKLSEKLKAALSALIGRGHIELWAQCIASWHVGYHSEIHLHLFHGWRNFILILARSQNIQFINDEEKLSVLCLCIQGLNSVLKHSFASSSSIATPIIVRLAANSSALIFMLTKLWLRCAMNSERVVSLLTDVLEHCSLLAANIPSVVAGITATHLLLIQSSNGCSSIKSHNLLRSVKVLSEVCSMVCDSSMLFRTCSFADDTIAMEDDSWEDEESIILKDRLYDSATHIKVTQNDFNKALATRELSIKVQTICVHFLTETLSDILKSIGDNDNRSLLLEQWIVTVQQHLVTDKLFSSLLPLLQVCHKTENDFVMSALSLCYIMTQHKQTADILVSSGFFHRIFLQPYLPAAKESSWATSNSCNSFQKPKRVFSTVLRIITNTLLTLNISALDSIIQFTAVHEQQLDESLNLSDPSDIQLLSDCVSTCHLISALSNHTARWRMHTPQVMLTLLRSMSMLFENVIVWLMRPSSLQYQREMKAASGHATVSFGMQRLLSVQQHDDTDSQASSESQLVQLKLLEILSSCVMCWFHLSPDICEALLYANLNSSQFEPLVKLSYSLPSVGAVPSFGTLFAGIDLCLAFCNKTDTSEDNEIVSRLRTLATFCLEHLVIISMAQALIYFRDPYLSRQDKQRLKRELATELGSSYQCLSRIQHRHLPTDATSTQQPPRHTSVEHGTNSFSPSKAAISSQWPFQNIINVFIKHLS